jgi:hypothetical protein
VIKAISHKGLNYSNFNTNPKFLSQLIQDKYKLFPKVSHFNTINSCNVEILMVGQQSILGDEAFSEAFQSFTYYTTATCKSLDAEIYVCPLEVYA